MAAKPFNLYVEIISNVAHINCNNIFEQRLFIFGHCYQYRLLPLTTAVLQKTPLKRYGNMKISIVSVSAGVRKK